VNDAPGYVRLNAGETVVMSLIPWIWIVWPLHVLTLGLYAIWRPRNRIVLTNRRVIRTIGFVRKRERSLPLHLDDATTRRYFGIVGAIQISTAGGGAGEINRGTLYRAGSARKFVHLLNESIDGSQAHEAAHRQPSRRADVTPTDALSKLERMAALHRAGALSDEEFAEQKVKLLEGGM